MFKCTDCKHEFDTADVYEEHHGLDTPPYERIAVCPKCQSTEFVEWEPCIEKIEAARTLIYALTSLNRLQDNINDVFTGFANEELENAQGLLFDFIIELYDDFISNTVSKKIIKASTKNDAELIMLELEG